MTRDRLCIQLHGTKLHQGEWLFVPPYPLLEKDGRASIEVADNGDDEQHRKADEQADERKNNV